MLLLLLQVPWPLVAQLEAAGVSTLRIISPAVLRPLLRAQQPKRPNEPHPFVRLSATQALQLLEYCCSDLTTPDERRPSNGSTSASTSISSRQDGAAATAAVDRPQQAAAGLDAAAVQAALPGNVPQGAAAMVADVFGPVGLAVLGGLASQMQQRLVTGVDDVLNAVMDAMGPPGEVQQQQMPSPQQQQRSSHVEAAAAATSRAAAAGLAAAADAAGEQGPSPVNLNKVSYLKGLPVPTAAGTVAVLGVARLYVFPAECSPAPTALMPAHLLQQFVLPECISALAWLLKYPEVQRQLRLTFYGLDQLAGHLEEALAPTWRFTGAAVPTGLPAHRAAAACMPGAPGFPAVVAWDDGAAGGPYFDWLVKLWRVMLQTVAAAPEWQTSISAGAAGVTSAAGSSGSIAAGGGGAAGGSSGFGGLDGGLTAGAVADGIRSAAQRARGLAEVIAGEVAQALNSIPGPGASSNQQGGAGSAPSAGGVLSGEREAAEAVWRPLLDWPLLPLADGRLLKLRYRELALAVLPEYQQGARAVGKSTQEGAEQEVSTVWDALLDQCFSF